ncbi:hypothetical protein TWF569_003117 [Orbilia oligospora]|uniref:Uncharacterized protein n=1 Tax=Orbilia oligospora TaxID=2813651 RepID=A0A7C8J6J8_ORBOL|nr:hypothetical protein TWF102_001730 [Orbilia oligospora]KAF3082218.1 hypothetical protein TWF103_003396 [Orbilia oligospora]KAF3120548.1 hypothetical protein TWF569_003117 [Orbilia oligospora]KAF3143602.1 hypothetical protein TWF594_005149 [Orbilia oligospora]
MLCRNQDRTSERISRTGREGCFGSCTCRLRGCPVESRKLPGPEVEGLKGRKKKNFVECNRLDLYVVTSTNNDLGHDIGEQVGLGRILTLMFTEGRSHNQKEKKN